MEPFKGYIRVWHVHIYVHRQGDEHLTSNFNLHFVVDLILVSAASSGEA
jgi:hypothetical protein